MTDIEPVFLNLAVALGIGLLIGAAAKVLVRRVLRPEYGRSQ